MLKIGIGDNWVDNVGLNQFVSLIDLETGMLIRTIRIQGHSISEIAGENTSLSKISILYRLSNNRS